MAPPQVLAEKLGTLAELIEAIGYGELNGQASEALRALVARCHDVASNGAGKAKGKLVLTLNVVSTSAGVLEITPELKTTAPQPPAPKAILYANDDGTMATRDPRQPQLPLRDASVRAFPSRKPDEGSGATGGN